jgi:hypothetical protein
MNKKLFVFTLLLAVATSLAATWPFSTPKTKMGVISFKTLASDYDALWKEVQDLENQGLYKSALEKVDQILGKARLEKSHENAVKGVIYKLKYNSWLEEDDYIKAIALLDELTASSSEPLKQFMHSITASTYYSYFNQNSWRFYQRTTASDVDKEDIRTWDLRTFMKTIRKEYLLSLENQEVLRNTNIADYKHILQPDSADLKMRPTLYDLLIDRAINFFSTHNYYLSDPADQEKLSNTKLLGDAPVFLAQLQPVNDSSSQKNIALYLLGDWMKFHNNNNTLKVDIDIRRLDYVRNNIALQTHEADTLYYQTVYRMMSTYRNDPVAPRVAHFVAGEMSERAGSYNWSDDKTHAFRWERKKAIALLKKYAAGEGDWNRNCSIMADDLQRTSLHIQQEQFAEPGKPFRMVVRYTNLNKAYFRLIKLPDTYMLDQPWRKLGDDKNIYDHLLLQKPVKEWSKDLPNEGDFQIHSIEVATEPAEHGFYVVLFADNANMDQAELLGYSALYVTSLNIQYRLFKEKAELAVLNAFGGEPLPGTNVTLYKREYNQLNREYELKKVQTLKTDENGTVSVNSGKDDRNLYVRLQNSMFREDILLPNTIYTYYYHYDDESRYQAFLFTDRAIYRPGQTIYFKAIVGEKSKTDRQKAAVGKKITVTLMDPNYEEAGNVELTTNAFGSVSGSFTAPTGRLAGSYSLVTDYGTHYIRVEEYKRPRFEVETEPLKTAYKLGDKVEVTGVAKGYSGNVVDGAKVRYWITRSTSFPSWKYWIYSRGYDYVAKEIGSGEIVTDAEGRYRIPLLLTPDSTVDKKAIPTFSYSIRVEVTDVTGETRGTSHYLQAAYHTMNMYVGIPGVEYIAKQAKWYKLSTNNLSGKHIGGAGTITIHKIETPGQPYRKLLWSRPEHHELSKDAHRKQFPFDLFDNENDANLWKTGNAVRTIAFNTAQVDSFQLLVADLAPGDYKIVVSGKDSLGNPAEHEQNFRLMAKANGKPATQEFFSLSQENYSVPVGDTAYFLLASGHRVSVRMDVEKDGVILKTEYIKLDHEQKRIGYPVGATMEGNFNVHFMCLSEGQSWNKQMTVNVPYVNARLNVKFETFRNKMLPGSQEEWKIKVTGEGKEAVAAELMAVMYDQSLDAFSGNYFGFYPYSYSYAQTYWQGDVDRVNSGYTTYRKERPYRAARYPRIPQLNWFGLSNEYYYQGYGSYGGNFRGNRFAATGGATRDFEGYYAADMISKKAESIPAAPARESTKSELGAVGKVAVKSTVLLEQSGKDNGGEYRSEDRKTGEGDKFGSIQARTNLNETAFFYPQLTTDKGGSVILKFTMPEALTRWKFMALAHTPDFRYGELYEEVVTQKELMVLPNLPRFLREGDRIELSAKVSNLTEKDVTGSAKLMLFDAITMQPVDAQFQVKNAVQEFKAGKGQSAPLYWTVKVPEGIEAVTCRIVAETGKHSDGEEMALPVLMNKVLVTETLPLTVRKAGKTDFTFKRLMENKSTTLRHHKYTLEFTANPAWYAVQALPYMMEYPYECNEQVFSRLYANALASHVANSNPAIKRVFDAWKTLDNGSALLSNLQKNQDLKALMLEETPWVIDAKNENERKKRVALLFDINNMTNQLGKAVTQLRKGQYQSGGWPWFSGMHESRWVTQYTVTGFGHLTKLNALDDNTTKDVEEMVRKAMAYLDAQMLVDYNYIKRHYTDYLKTKHLSEYTIQYLYARSFFPSIPVPSNCKEAFTYFEKQAATYWLDYDIRLEALIGITAVRSGDTALVKKIIASHKERAITNDDMGMYWKEIVAGYYWYQAPIETQATMIELFHEAGESVEMVDNMRIWLLRQKQTTDWKTTTATANAVYALLMGGTTDMLADTQLPEIVVGNQKIEYNVGKQPEAGTGYIRRDWHGTEINEKMASVSVTRASQGFSWGALYWQYFEVPDKVTRSGNGLQVEKKMYRLKRSARDNEAELLGEGVVLEPGDRIRHRIIITADRNYEFVHMKDMRAAGTEPLQVFSAYRWQDGLGYYQSTRDAATNFFFDYLPKGTYVIEYDLAVQLRGEFSNGLCTIQSMYAPEFAGHANGSRLSVGKE